MSEVARLRRQIEMECEAMQRGFSAFAISARHDIIQHRYQSIGKAQEQLQQLVGKAEARRITVETYVKVMG